MTGMIDVAGLGAGAVVVGVDGSGHSHLALATALHEATLRSAPVVAVTTYESPDRWGPEAAGLIDLGAIERELREGTEAAVSAVAEEVAAGGTAVPEVRVVVTAGSAADVLCHVATGALLLVVGHRGRGALATRLIGSVGLGVVVHASCPVLVVRTTQPAGHAPAVSGGGS